MPLDWAKTQHNLGNVEIAFFDKSGAVAHLERAERHVTAARQVYAEAGASHYLLVADSVLADIARRRGESDA